MPTAYSYTRFSNPEQAKGNSKIRQIEKAREYAKSKNLDLDDTVFFDEGKSAFSGSNKQGALGAFLRLVQDGHIEKNSVLLVESLDRISRQTPRKAANTLGEIVDEGITVVTFSDGKEYTNTNLDSDGGFSFLMSILIFMRAHEESAMKSRRHLDNWSRKRANAANKAMTAVCPGWLQRKSDGSGYEPIPERTEVVRYIFESHLQGVGIGKIAETLNQKGVETWGVKNKQARQWYKSYITKILCNPAVIGEFTPHLCTKLTDMKGCNRTPLETLHDYYPAVIEKDLFYKVQELHKDSLQRGKKPCLKIQSIAARLVKCPFCGSNMLRVTKGAKSFSYLICSKAKGKAGCHAKYIRIDKFEQALLNGLTQRGGVPFNRNASALLSAEIEGANKRKLSATEELQNYLDAIGAGEVSNETAFIDGYPLSIAQRVTMLENSIAANDANIERLNRLTFTAKNETVKAMIVELLEASKSPDDKQRLNSILSKLCSKIILNYAAGFIEVHFNHCSNTREIPFSGYEITVEEPDEGADDSVFKLEEF